MISLVPIAQILCAEQLALQEKIITNICLLTGLDRPDIEAKIQKFALQTHRTFIEAATVCLDRVKATWDNWWI